MFFDCRFQKCILSVFLLLSSSPGSLIFSMCMRKEGEPEIRSHATLMWCHEKEALSVWISPPTSVYQTQLFEAFNDPTYTCLKALAPYLSSMLNWNTWKYSSPMLSYHNPPPFLPLYMEWRLSREIVPAPPPFSYTLRCSGSLGTMLASGRCKILKPASRRPIYEWLSNLSAHWPGWPMH